MSKPEYYLSLMKNKNAVILSQNQNGGGDIYIITPYGDRRRRPLAWINIKEIKLLQEKGYITGGPDKYVLALGTVL